MTRITVGQVLRSLALINLCALPAMAEDRAVIVGVNEYIYSDQDLRKAVSDAQTFARFARTHLGFKQDQIITLYDEAATKPAIYETLVNRVIRETEPGDRVLFYFSGHGARVPDTNSDEDDQRDEVLVLADSGGPISNGRLSDDELRVIFETIPNRRVLIVVDACHSGTITRDLTTDSDELIRAMVLPESEDANPAQQSTATRSLRASTNSEGPIIDPQAHMAVWSAVSPTEYAIEDKDGGVFTRFFLEGVVQKRADFNRNNQVSNAELLRYVRNQSANFCGRARSCAGEGRRMTPDFAGKQADLAAFGGAPVPPKPPAAQPVPETVPENTAAPDDAPLPPVTIQDVIAPDPVGSITDLFTDQNPADLSLRLSTGPRMRIGDPVQFDFAANRGGHLMLFDLNPRGELFQIYPSPLSPMTVPTGNAQWSMSIPNGTTAAPVRIRASEPAGRGTLIAILMEDRIEPALAMLPANAELAPIPDARSHLEALVTHLNDLKADADGARPFVWSAQVLPYSITR